MTTKLRFPILLSLFTLAVGAVGCSNGQSPTEPASFDTPVAAASSLSVAGDKRHGADDPAMIAAGARGAVTTIRWATIAADVAVMAAMAAMAAWVVSSVRRAPAASVKARSPRSTP